jgi:crotonobetainyl-CoA:carnitine CoA-transferase CaiB-like acyl-CoA transferase
MLPLEGVKVLDLSRLLPGPYATLLLADLGAQVDKVEEPTGDPTRHMALSTDMGSAVFEAVNRNKRSLTLDLKSPAGAATLKALVPHYDVLVESFRPGVMERLGVGAGVLQALNPRLIYCAITGYGQTGPDRLRAGHDLNYVARAGLLGLNGPNPGTPSVPAVQVGDIGGGSLFGVVGILAALHERSRTGTGRFVDVSMTDGALAFAHLHLGARVAMGPAAPPLERGRGALNGDFACYGLYRTGDDRHLAVAALEPRFFQGLCEALGRPELVEGGWDTGEAGQHTRRELAAIFAGEPLAHWVRFFAPLDVCVEPVHEGDEVLHDAQLQARGLFPEGAVRTPLDFGRVALRPAPALGAHTAEVLREAGLPHD